MVEYASATPRTIAKLTTKLRILYPQAFCEPPKPLALGINRKIDEALHSKDWKWMGLSFFGYSRAGVTLLDTMHSWTRSEKYSSAETAGAVRVDLAGAPVGVVTETEAIWAASELHNDSGASGDRLCGWWRISHEHEG